jgi:magnesium-transporting ATPase (P-type)
VTGVPADGCLLSWAWLEVQESSLTGEAQPTSKSAAAEVDERAPVGDRVTAVFMGRTGTEVTNEAATMVLTDDNFATASLTGAAGGAPFTALQILFVDLVMDGPPAIASSIWSALCAAAEWSASSYVLRDR